MSKLKVPFIKDDDGHSWPLITDQLWYASKRLSREDYSISDVHAGAASIRSYHRLCNMPKAERDDWIVELSKDPSSIPMPSIPDTGPWTSWNGTTHIPPTDKECLLQLKDDRIVLVYKPQVDTYPYKWKWGTDDSPDDIVRYMEVDRT